MWPVLSVVTTKLLSVSSATLSQRSSSKERASAIKPFYDELNLLVTALDEFHAGRMVEVGDILSSRLRMLTAGIEKGSFRLARHFLVYHTKDSSLCSDSLMDEALRIEERTNKREKKMAAARNSRPVVG